jgi:hypothetical protein
MVGCLNSFLRTPNLAGANICALSQHAEMCSHCSSDGVRCMDNVFFLFSFQQRIIMTCFQTGLHHDISLNHIMFFQYTF